MINRQTKHTMHHVDELIVIMRRSHSDIFMVRQASSFVSYNNTCKLHSFFEDLRNSFLYSYLSAFRRGIIYLILFQTLPPGCRILIFRLV